MRLAVIADTHGNLLALEAVLADIKTQAPDAIVDLGDCVSGPLWPRETADLLMSLKLPTARGNHDRTIVSEPLDKMGASCKRRLCELPNRKSPRQPRGLFHV